MSTPLAVADKTFVCVTCKQTLPAAKAMNGHYCIVPCMASDGDSGSVRVVSCENRLCHDCYVAMDAKDKCPATDHGMDPAYHDTNVVWIGGPCPYTLVDCSDRGCCYVSDYMRLELDPTDSCVTVKKIRDAIARRSARFRKADYNLRHKGRCVYNGKRLADLGVVFDPRWPSLSLSRKGKR
jgi:hypothetical protein